MLLTITGLFPRSVHEPTYQPRVINSWPHDPQAFCQGLVFHRGRLLESTGHYGSSSLRHVDWQTGRLLRIVNLPREYFAEGITVLQGLLYQLTWKERVGFVYDPQTLEHQATFRYQGEGWGLTTDGTHLILSDGTATLKFLDPATYQVKRKITVRSSQGEVPRLNELEYIDGLIWANIWYSDKIACIAPQTGRVVSWVDLSHLWPASQRPSREHVLNGIAYDAEQDLLLVTGKNWPRIYQIEKVSQPRNTH